MLKKYVKVKRDGYTFHSFLEKGTYNAAYIDTGLIMTGFIAKFKCSWRTTNGYFVGSHNNSSPYARQGFYLRGNNQWELGLFETINQKNYSGVIDKVYDIEFSTDPSNGYAIIDGVKLFEGISTTPTEPKGTITLFKMGQWPTLTAGKLFETWIYDLNRNIVAHYLPASRDSDGVCGMYDLVTDTFLTNANTVGTFTVGEEKDFYEWKEIKEIKRLKTPRLPKEFQEVEYIESTGTQWIDTGIKSTEGYTLEIYGRFTKLSSYQLFGEDTSRKGLQFGINGTGSKWFLGVSSMSGFGTADTLLHKFECKAESSTTTSLRIDDLSDNDHYYIGRESSFPSNGTIVLFARGYNNAQHNCYCYFEMRRTRITLNGNDLINYIPCYRKSDGEVGMYDKVNEVFHTNQGTGTFLKGADVKFNTIKKINKVIEGEIKTINLG